MISVVIPNFNSGHLLAKNLSKLDLLLKKSGLEYEIIISDDASTDDSVAILTGFNPVTSSKNTGFGTCVDRGIKASKGEVVFILNVIDILPESPDYFKIMLKHFDVGANHDSPVFSVGAAKKDSETHGCGEIYFEKGFFLHRKGRVIARNEMTKQSSYNESRLPRRSAPRNDIYSDWADGGAQALRKEYYLKIGGFDPIYKFYWEDVDLGYRATKAGYEVHFEPKAALVHNKAEGPIAKFYSEKDRRIMNLRNQFIFTWKNGNWRQRLENFVWLPYYLRHKDFFVAFWQALIAYVNRHDSR